MEKKSDWLAARGHTIARGLLHGEKLDTITI